MTEANRVWNRATSESGGSHPCAGDRALAALLRAHGLTMNGGILHAIELLNECELAAAKSGFHFFGFNEVENLIGRAKDLFDAKIDLDSFERLLDDDEYSEYIPDDATIAQRFERHFHAHPSDFAPL